MKRRGDISERTDGTCDWVLEDPQYTSWVAHGGLLWIKGGPGTGKSTIMASLLDHVTANSHIASFFFHRRGSDLQHMSIGFLRSLLHQILCIDSNILSKFRQDVQFDVRCQRESNNGPTWTDAELRKHLISCVKQFTKDHVLCLYIDALDESGESTARDLMAYLERLREEVPTGLRICVSCRPWPNVISKSNYCINVAENNTRDIELFVRESFKHSPQWSKPDTLNEILEQIVGRALGVFQWAVLVVKRVLSLHDESTDYILTEIKKIPPEIGKVYQEMLGQLEAGDRDLVLRIFQWITFALRPLTLDELWHAVAVEPDRPLGSLRDLRLSAHWCEEINRMASRVGRLSRGLINVVDAERPEVLDHHTWDTDTDPGQVVQLLQFSHESVREYTVDGGIMSLESSLHLSVNSNIIGRTQRLITSSCLRYLGAFAADDPDLFESGNMTMRRAPFLVYSAGYGMKHAYLAQNNGVQLDIFGEVSVWPSTKIWARRQWHLCQHRSREPRDETIFKHFEKTSLSHIAAANGLHSVLTTILTRSRKRKPLDKLMSHLRKGRIMEMRDLNGRTPLSYAAEFGDEKTVELLLSSCKVDVDTANYDYRTPITIAVERGHAEVVRLLLKTGKVDIERRNVSSWEYTALQFAACRGYFTVVEILLAARADVNAPAGKIQGRTALQAAAGKGHVEMVGRLLGAGADVNAPADVADGRTALQAAAGGGYVKIVEKLLIAGADVDAPAAFLCGLTALQAAASGGHLPVMKILLDAGAHVNAELNGQYGKTALQAAAEHGHLAAVETLLAAAAIVNCTSGRPKHDYDIEWRNPGLTALQLAAKGRFADIVRVLLDAGADVHVRSDNERGATALHYAAMTGDMNLNKLLVSAGADIEALDNQGKTALAWVQDPSPFSYDKPGYHFWPYATSQDLQQVAAYLLSQRTAIDAGV
jgi:ankyrin repeat protein